mmetsp:Transcript_27613/g.45227  ORF Transcript_27613/g.45227 Transcript_27613/m.45227 type:complete len:288 (+) Transcript_27613:1193-2056(+)
MATIMRKQWRSSPDTSKLQLLHQQVVDLLHLRRRHRHPPDREPEVARFAGPLLVTLRPAHHPQARLVPRGAHPGRLPAADLVPGRVTGRLHRRELRGAVGPPRVGAHGGRGVQLVHQHGGRPGLHLPRHPPVHRSLGELQVVDLEVDHQLVVLLVGEELVHVLEHGHVTAAGLQHHVEPLLLGRPHQQHAQHLGHAAVAAEDRVLAPGVLGNVLHMMIVELAELLVGNRRDHVVQLTEEAVAAAGELIGLESLPVVRGSFRGLDGLLQHPLKPRLVDGGGFADAVQT